jgi:hypothetical protein
LAESGAAAAVVEVVSDSEQHWVDYSDGQQQHWSQAVDVHDNYDDYDWANRPAKRGRR